MFTFAVFKISLILLINKAITIRSLDHCANVAYANICVQLGEKLYLIDGNAQLNWFDAERFCRRQDGFLANIEDQNEMDAISKYLVSKNYLEGDQWFWIGGNKLGSESVYYSVKTGDVMPFTNWTPGQPDNAYGNENCALLWKHDGGFAMNDCGCDAKVRFICEIKRSNNFYVGHTVS